MTQVRPSAVLSGRYRRALDIAAVIVVAGWQVAGAGSLMVGDRAAYGSYPFQVGAWLVLAAVIAAGSVRLLRGWSGRSWAWALAGLALATSVIAAAATAEDRLGLGRGRLGRGASAAPPAPGRAFLLLVAGGAGHVRDPGS